jgi:hypothetical protein
MVLSEPIAASAASESVRQDKKGPAASPLHV